MKQWFWMAALLLVLPMQAKAISAAGAIVIDADSHAVLLEQNADTVLPMASTTKIMTALIALEHGDLDRVYPVQKEYTQIEGSSMYLREGEQLTIRDTLYGLLLESGNDAAVALAGECGGQTAFVREMNEKAAALGLTRTHFENPNGLDGETHHTTARDLALLTAEAMHNDTFCQIVSTQKYVAGNHILANHNRLLRENAEIIGVKTGYTRKSGRCLVSAAERNGRRLICVTLNDPNDWEDHLEWLKNAFDQYKWVTLQQAGETLFQRTVYGGVADTVPLIAVSSLRVFMTEQERTAVARHLRCRQIEYAPVKKNQAAGTVYYLLDGFRLGEGSVAFGMSIAMLPEEKTMPQRLWDWMTGSKRRIM